MRSQASFPPTVARTQLLSPCALPIGGVIWYADLLETPSLAQGTLTPLTQAHDGRTNPMHPSGEVGRFEKELFTRGLGERCRSDMEVCEK